MTTTKPAYVTAINVSDDTLTRIAHALVVSVEAYNAAAPRTKALAVAKAKLDGQLDIVDRLGLVRTPFAGQLITQDAIRNAGPKPPYGVVNNSEQNAWYRRVAAAVVAQFDEPSL